MKKNIELVIVEIIYGYKGVEILVKKNLFYFMRKCCLIFGLF